MMTRGVRGATTADENSSDSILEATRQLLALLIRRNEIEPEDVASAIFTTTPDLDAEFPALAARQLNWMQVPLMCTHEIMVPGSLEKCVRVLINWNTDKKQDEIHHVYIRDALSLRPDLCKLPAVDWEELEDWIRSHLNEKVKSPRARI
jgi:chorismate mutase